MKYERGAALTETFILMLVLTPIMFGVPMIGKLIDLRQATVQASRYAAWEATVSNRATAPVDINARFFSASGVALGGDASAPNALWGDTGERVPHLADVPAQTAKSFLGSDHMDVRIDGPTGAAVPYRSAYDHGAEGGAALLMQNSLESAGNAVGTITQGEWMDSGALQGMLRGEVRADVQGNGIFERLTFNDATVIIYDNWSAEGDETSGKRARTMVPAGALEEVGNLFSVFGNVPLLKELKNLDGAFGHVDMQPLPASESRRRQLENYQE